ncbi:MAG: hypothetical protein UX21_C0005G0002 [Microgenomates group bacterium GW2011_GWC2_45_8]|nr:MAG: hypothetical protein UX21_C0005G0002 [Microgenomates group bacterium GW2011_GWC2_45_8]
MDLGIADGCEFAVPRFLCTSKSLCGAATTDASIV